MPGVNRLGWRHGLIDSVREARSFGVNQVVLFPKASHLLALRQSVYPSRAKSSCVLQTDIELQQTAMHLKHVAGYLMQIACDMLEVLLHSCLLQ